MWNVILATLAVSLISLIGALLLFKEGLTKSTYGSLLVSMAAGVMLSTAMLDLLPEAMEYNLDKHVYWTILAGVVAFFILERSLISFHHHDHGHLHAHVHEEKSVIKPSAYLILFGDTFHNFFDGMAIATAFSINFQVGIATTIAVILHEIPHELANFVALVHSGFSEKKALIYNFISALPALIGALAGWYFLHLFGGVLPYFIGFNTGMFIYIACSDMIPALHEEFKLSKKWQQTAMFLFGVLLMGVLISMLHE